MKFLRIIYYKSLIFDYTKEHTYNACYMDTLSFSKKIFYNKFYTTTSTCSQNIRLCVQKLDCYCQTYIIQMCNNFKRPISNGSVVFKEINQIEYIFQCGTQCMSLNYHSFSLLAQFSKSFCSVRPSEVKLVRFLLYNYQQE